MHGCCRRLVCFAAAAPENPRTGLRERLKHQFYLVEYLPLTLEAALARDFHGVRPPFQWVIAVLSDVRACVRWSLWLCVR